MHIPRAAGEPVTPAVAALGALAADGCLVVCAGAGLSKPEPAGLPLGWELAEIVYEDLKGRLGEDALAGADPRDLLSVADLIEARQGGAALLQASLRQAANFTGAQANYGHVALALLLLEGALEVILTNYDDCIERGGGPYGRLQIIVTDVDSLQVRGPAVLKVHGCATRDGSLRASTKQLEDPPTWVFHHFGQRLGTATVVFVGLGDVAAYVQIRIRQLLEALGSADRVWLASTSLSDAWRDLVPDISDRFIEMSADDFLDELLRDYVRIALRRLREHAERHRDARTYEAAGVDPARGAETLTTALSSSDALSIVIWVREAGSAWALGEAVMQSERLREALLALALGACRKEPSFDGRHLRLDGERVDIVLAREAIAPTLVTAQEERIAGERADGRVGIRETVTLLCHGHQGELPRTVLPSVIPGDSAEDVVDGPNVPLLRLISVPRVLEGDLPEEWAA